MGSASLGTAATTLSRSLSSSPPPPVIEYDSIIGDRHQSESRYQSTNPSLSPEISRLPAPRTPASFKSRDTHSDYYTAVWGSPYDLSPSQFSRSARTAVSEQLPSDDLSELSPGPDFGLEHLVPSRLSDLSLHQPGQPSQSSLGLQQDAFDPTQTPRSRTQRWVQLPQREESSERVHWWSDESVHSEPDSQRKRARASSSASSAHHARLRSARPGHKPRENNRTLDQQSFWETVREGRSGDMSSLLESRWAATPEPTVQQSSQPPSAEQKPAEGLLSSEWAATPEPPAEDHKKEDVVSEKPKDGVFASRWAETPEPPVQSPPETVTKPEKPKDGVFASRWADTPPPEEDQVEIKFDEVTAKPPDQQFVAESMKSRDEIGNAKNALKAENEVKVVEPVSSAVDSTGMGISESLPQQQTPSHPSATPMRLEPPRLKKRVSWKGKNIVISIPRIDYEAAGLVKPMSKAEIDERLKQFEDQGYSTYGFDLAEEEAIVPEVPAQVRAIFPPEAESRVLPGKDQFKVLLPDLEKWKAYTNWLTEQKLAALGVTLGNEEPAPAPSQEISRQSSGQYPPLPFSPPIPTTSAGSLGRPGMVRGHSHTMSVAAPASPLNGPFGHMHRHSTLTGLGGLSQLQQLQQPQQSPGIPGMQPFSPQQQFGFPGLPRGGSPAQLSALRQDLGSTRGPGSPLSQQMMPQQTSQDYSRGIMEDQRRRQHAYSQSMAAPSMPNAFMPQTQAMRPTPALPELPEDEDEEEELQEPEPEPSAYVPPHKRVQANTEIAVPTPRGHRHNISEGLERELLEAEQRQKAASRDWIEVTEEEEQPSFQKTNGLRSQPPSKPAERDPLGAEHLVKETAHSRKKSGPRFNVAAPSFTFNPSANFQPGAAFQPSASFVPPKSDFTFGSTSKTNGQVATNHNRHQSSGSFNVTAPAFKPTNTEFSFSSSGPAFNQKPEPAEPSDQTDRNVVDELPSIFGKVNIPDIVKPARRSKAVAIVRPEEGKSASNTDFEDDEGRVAQGDAKRKQQRKTGDDGDSVPLFAEPTKPRQPAMPPADKILGSNDGKVEEVEAATNSALEELVEAPEDSPIASDQQVAKELQPTESATQEQRHGHKHSSSLSALAKPFQPPAFSFKDNSAKGAGHDDIDSISDLEEGEIEEEATPSVSPIRASAFGPQPTQPVNTVRPAGPKEYSSSERIDQVAHPEPSFDEIDAVMRQLNAEESEKETEKLSSPARLPSPGSHPMKGVTYLPAEQPDWSRSDAPSPSPRRKQLGPQDLDSGDQILNGWPQVRQLNKADDANISDWSGILSPNDEEKLQQRSHFFDNHIDKLIGRVVEQRLQPLEESLRNIHSTVSKRARSTDLKLHRSPSNVDSDADDEDELSDGQKQRPISRGRDKRVDQIKAAVLEALREQSPRRTQASMDLTELHSVLADMKVSFARAASASLELDDIRAVVEDSLNRQSQAVVPITIDDRKDDHRRQLSELEGRLNETLAGALEEANQREAMEKREIEAKRQLRLAEEELQLQRDSAHDDASKARAMEKEREDLIHRLERSEEERRNAEEKLDDTEAEKDALQATLDEYRRSSNKWRQDLDEGKRVREELENTMASIEQQNQDYQESTSTMRRRLEKLHSDTATAAGQFASEKAIWKSKQEDYRAKIEALESQHVAFGRERAGLDEELRVLRAQVVEAAESRHSFDHLRATNSSMDEMVRRLQADLTEQQSLTARYERQFYDAQESGRAEVHRTRLSLETEVEAANHQVNLIRADLESELATVRTELENVKMEAETAKARYEHLLEQEETARREALRKVNHSNSVALDEARHKYESAIRDLTVQHSRALSHAVEDKERIESFLNEKLALSDAKLSHFQDRVVHLEERLDVARSAAQAAASSAKASKSVSQPTAFSGIPEKVSPQALRESILVLQEQLQERESRIERLQAQAEQGPVKLKERDTEINWLRELLNVRSDELEDLVNTLSRPKFDRAAVRDTAIRIRTNLQMELQEKERSGLGQPSLGGQAIASLSSFATPRAAQLTTAFNKWRSTMESSALKSQQRPAMPGRSYTPSKVQARPQPARYPSGLMTPPASNLRSSPLPEESGSLPPPRLTRSESKTSAVSSKGSAEPPRSRSRHASGTSNRSHTPLLHEQSYDQDAEDGAVQSFEDDDLDDVADSEPPAFRSLESELEEPAAATEDDDEM